MIMANGTQHATAQQIPSNEITNVPAATLLTKKVLIIKQKNRSNAPVQMLRSIRGMVGSLRGLPSRAASARHCLTRSRTRASSASAVASGLLGSIGSSGSNKRWSREARKGRRVPAATATETKHDLVYIPPAIVNKQPTYAIDKHCLVSSHSRFIFGGLSTSLFRHNNTHPCRAEKQEWEPWFQINWLLTGRRISTYHPTQAHN
jgi:hypothetical protein